MKNVHIMEKKTGRVVTSIAIQLSGANYTPSAQE